MEVSEETKAEEFKTQGNQCVKTNKFAEAIDFYTKALDLSKDNKKRAIYLSNRAQCHIKSESPGFALEDAKQAVKADETYVKGFYRLGSSHFMLGNLEESLKAFVQAKKLTKGQDKDVLEKIKTIQDSQRRKQWEDALAREETSPLDPQKFEIPSSYEGPKLDKIEQITAGWVQEMMEFLQKQKQLAKRTLLIILIQVKEILKKEATLINYTIPDDEEFTVCGDVHGQYYDLLNIFKINGNPSEQNPYLFNGDFVDRGSFSLEVMITLFAWKCVYPNQLCLTRGNHECRNMNQLYGFEGEVVSQYDPKIFEIFADTFCCLPLGYVLNNKVFITHGGLFKQDGVKLEDIKQTDRFREPPDLGIMCDMLWADPVKMNGRHPSKRGVSIGFGPDIAHKFLDDNQLELLVRSHEMKEQGYEVEASGRVITIFSAPNYCDQMGNKGAFIKFKGSEMKPNFTQFSAVEHPAVPPMAYARNMYNFM